MREPDWALVVGIDGFTAQLSGNKVVYSVVLSKAGNPLNREDVKIHFKDELEKK